MSRIRGIVQKEVLQSRKYELNEFQKKNEDQSANSKDDVESKSLFCLLLRA